MEFKSVLKYIKKSVAVFNNNNDRLRSLKTPLLLLELEDRITPSLTPIMVKDINAGPGNSAPKFFTPVGSTVFFSAIDSSGGRELWKTDGTDSGTIRVKDINPGLGNSDPQYLTNVNGVLFFQANDGNGGIELWKSDGTTNGTIRVKDINSGAGDSNPRFLINMGGIVYFAANNGTVGNELWRSDGTDSGTSLVKNIDPSSLGSNPGELIVANGMLYFHADDGTYRTELWKSDGTEAGTVRLTDISPMGGDSFITQLTNVNGSIFFWARDGVTGFELWKNDGINPGAIQVKDINPGPNSSYPRFFANVNGVLYFKADDGVSGYAELWKSDGTQTGTVRVKDINPGAPSAGVVGLTNVNGILYFYANDGLTGLELWKSDGTEIGTSIVKDINPGPYSSNPELFTVVNDQIFFKATNVDRDNELWVSDGTEAGTFQVADINFGPYGSGPSYLANANGVLYFQATNGVNGLELWKVSLPNRPPMGLSLSSSSTVENNLINSLVGSFNTTDPDVYNTFTYSLVSGAGSSDNGFFSVNGNQLCANSSFDFETKSSYSIRIRTTDQDGLFLEKQFTISVTNINEAPAFLALSSNSIAENLANNAVIGSFTTTDPDFANTFTYSLVGGTGGNSNNLFNISGNQLRANASFDFETASSYIVLVRSTDQGGLSATIRFTGTLAQTNAALGSLSYITPTDALAGTSVGVLVQRASFSASQNITLVAAENRVARVSDPALAGKVSVVIQGTGAADSISVQRSGATANYTVFVNGTPTVVTGITGRFVVFGLGGDDTISMTGSAVAVRADGGEGNDVILGGVAADALFGGNGADLIAGGLGADLINGGAGNDIVIDGTVSVRAAGKTLRSVLDGWAAKAAPVDADYAAITADLAFTADKASKDTLTGGLGTDWFWSATAGAVADVLDLVAGERRRLV